MTRSHLRHHGIASSEESKEETLCLCSLSKDSRAMDHMISYWLGAECTDAQV